MKIIVCGAGQVGANIALQLSRENHDVTVIDQSPELIRKIGDSIDVKAMVGFASHPGALEKAGASDVDMIIAVTYSDEVNMIACQVAHSLFDVPRKIARVRNQAYLAPMWSNLFSRDHMPIDVIISPEIEVAHAVNRRMHVPGAFDMVPFAGGRIQAIGVRLDENCPIVNTPLRQLTELFPDLNIRVVGIWRGDHMIVPSGDDQMLPGDDIYFVADTTHVSRAMPLFGHEEQEARRAVIVGGGNVGLFLARQLEREHPSMKLKVIESRKERAEFIADQLSRSVVLHGDALDPEILAEANVRSSEAIVTLTNDDKTNILASLLAKREGCAKAVTLINTPVYNPLVTSLGIDVVVNPRASTVSTILQFVRRGRIRGLHSLRDGVAELIEAEALETSSLINTPLSEIDLPSGISIGAILRGDEVLIAKGATEIKPRDAVVVFALSPMVKKVEELFSVQLEFF